LGEPCDRRKHEGSSPQAGLVSEALALAVNGRLTRKRRPRRSCGAWIPMPSPRRIPSGTTGRRSISCLSSRPADR
jgi:hypothetical protein